MDQPKLRASTKKRGTGYTGVLRNAAGDIVAECNHDHETRDQNRWLHPSRSYGDFPEMRSAHNCARVMLKAASKPISVSRG